MPPPNLLQALLACDRLAEGWYDFYGLSEARSEALTAPSTRKAGYSSDSFDNPNSETAITLFLLGNVDGWKQLDALPETPRIGGGRWNPKFFERLTSSNPPGPFTSPSRWSTAPLAERMFDPNVVDYGRLMLLFEVEAGGQAFRQATGTAGQGIELSFLKLDGLSRWAKFDAVLIDPRHRRFYLIEAKLGSDLSLETEKYPLVNQAVRSLEAGYWLTHHPASKYAGWSFRFVLVCPRPLWEYRLRLYAHLLWNTDSVAEMLGHYRRFLIDHHAADLRLTGDEFGQQFDLFVTEAKNAVRVVHWNMLADAVAPAESGFWNDYFRMVEGAYCQVRSADQARQATEAILARLRTANALPAADAAGG